MGYFLLLYEISLRGMTVFYFSPYFSVLHFSIWLGLSNYMFIG